MRNSAKGGLVIVFILSMSIFGYSQYISASQIDVSVYQSELFYKDDTDSFYNIEFKITNPSLLLLNVGDMEFTLSSVDATLGTGNVESFTLFPMQDNYVKGTFFTDANEFESIKISGTITYSVFFSTVKIPFEYHPTDEQIRKFVDSK